MTTTPTPPPLPLSSSHPLDPRRGFRQRRLTNKLILIAVVMLMLQVPLWLINSTRDERAERYGAAVSDVTQSWGGAQLVTGPMLVVPFWARSEAGTVRSTLGALRILPDALEITGEMQPQPLERGIYRTFVYTAALRLQGHFSVPADWGDPRLELDWSRARLVYAVSDARGLRAGQTLRWQGEEIPLRAGTGIESWPVGLQGRVSVEVAQPMTFALDLKLDGSEELEFVPVAGSTRVALTSTWSAPSFQGAFLPVNRTVNVEGFGADWEIGALGRDLPQWWEEGSAQDRAVADRMSAAKFGVGLKAAVGDYRTVERAIKYGILFLVTVFAGFFLFEMSGQRSLHGLNYLLVGAALCLFYLALLALSEFVRFGWAYLGAAGAATGLITFYAIPVLGAARRAGAMGLLLGGIYAYLYFVLQLEDMSLVAGTALLFGLLGAVMYATRHLSFEAETAAEIDREAS